MKLDDPALEPIVAKAIIDSITPEAREALIANAVKDLLNRPSGSGYNQPTNIQALFNAAVRQAAEKIAQEHLAEDPTFKANPRPAATEAGRPEWSGRHRRPDPPGTRGWDILGHAHALVSV
jgi:hypothetical protein